MKQFVWCVHRWALVSFLIFIFTVFNSRFAFAHSELVIAEPAPGQNLFRSPARVRLVFDEPISAQSDIIVFGDNFQMLNLGKVQHDPKIPSELVATLPHLSQGRYTVQWRVTSLDRDIVTGSYSFVVTGLLINAISSTEWRSSGFMVLFSLLSILAFSYWRKNIKQKPPQKPSSSRKLHLVLSQSLKIMKDPIYIKKPLQTITSISWRKVVCFFTSLTLLLSWALPLSAHGLGIAQFINVPFGTQLVSVWADPDPLRVGEVHVTVAISDPETLAPILGEEISVQLTYLEDSTVKIVSSALNSNASNKLFYEARFNVANEGEWEGEIFLNDSENQSDNLTFLLNVLSPEPVFTLWWFGRNALILLLFGWLVIIWKRAQKLNKRLSRVPKKRSHS